MALGYLGASRSELAEERSTAAATLATVAFAQGRKAEPVHILCELPDGPRFVF